MSGRIRSLKPEWIEDEALLRCSDAARVASAALLLLADDHGNGRGSDLYLGAQIFPGAALEKIRDAVSELARIRYVGFYEVDGQTYFAIRNWEKHQKVDRPGKPRVPKPLDDFRVTLAKIPVTPATSSRLTPIPIPTSYHDHDHDHDLVRESANREYDARAKLPTPIAQVRRAFLDGYAARYPNAKAYPWGSRENGQAKNLLKSIPLDELLELVTWFFQWKRPEVIRSGHAFCTGSNSLAMKHLELRADLAHPERREFAAEVASDEQQANHVASGNAQTARIVANATREKHATTGPALGASSAPGNPTLGRGETASRGSQPQALGRGDHRVVQVAGAVCPGNRNLASHGSGVRRGPHAEPQPDEGTDEGQAGDDAIYGPDDDSSGS